MRGRRTRRRRWNVQDGGLVHGDRHRGRPELARRLEIDRVFSLPDRNMAFAGRLPPSGWRTSRTRPSGRRIRVTEGTEVVTDYTEFVRVTGEFVVVSSGDREFAFDLIGAETNTNLERATLDLDGFFASHGSATPWRAGFSGNGDAGMNGVFHGADLRASHDLDSLLADSRLNQLWLLRPRRRRGEDDRVPERLRRGVPAVVVRRRGVPDVPARGDARPRRLRLGVHIGGRHPPVRRKIAGRNRRYPQGQRLCAASPCGELRLWATLRTSTRTSTPTSAWRSSGEAVEPKVEQMGGLADEETAAMLIAHELDDGEVNGTPTSRWRWTR